MPWLAAVADAEAWTLAMIVAASGVYAGALMAVGAVLFSLAFPDAPNPARRSARNMLALAARFGIVMLLLQWLLQAGYLGGGNLASALDPMLLAIVFEGAPGRRLLLALVGLVLVQAFLIPFQRPPKLAPGIGLVGVVLVLAAFTQVGHTTGEPRLLLSLLLGMHLLAAAFWTGSLWPLYRMAGLAGARGQAAVILARFGRIAAWAVAALLCAGILLAALLLEGLRALWTTAYGQLLLTKILVVIAILLLAAGNKWRLVPAFERRDARAPLRLRASIALEMALAAAVLLVTATLTTLSAPSGN